MVSLMLSLFVGSIILFFFGMKNSIVWLNVLGVLALAGSIAIFLLGASS